MASASGQGNETLKVIQGLVSATAALSLENALRSRESKGYLEWTGPAPHTPQPLVADLEAILQRFWKEFMSTMTQEQLKEFVQVYKPKSTGKSRTDSVGRCGKMTFWFKPPTTKCQCLGVPNCSDLQEALVCFLRMNG